MKTSYHYFPFIVISLLLHYLFFYFNSDTSAENFTIKPTYTNIKTTEEVIASTKSVSKKVMPISLPQLNTIQSIPGTASTPLQQTIQTEIVASSTILPETTQTEIAALSTPLQQNTRTEPIELLISQKQTTQAEIKSPLTTSHEITQAEIVASTTTQQKMPQTEIIASSTTQQEMPQTEILASSTLQEIPQIEQAESSTSLAKENERVLPVESYQVNVNTHTSGEVALLKEYVFERNLVNLPKIAVSKPSKKKKVIKTIIENATAKPTQPVVTTKNSEITTKTKINKTNQQMTALDTKNLNNKTSTITQHNSTATVKRIFKPKSDTTNISMAKQGDVLPQATAVSGKAPSYPKQAALQQQKGQVVVNMTVLPSGTTKEAEIIQSSGHEMLDKAVLNFIARELFMPSLEGRDRVPSKQSFFYSFE